MPLNTLNYKKKLLQNEITFKHHYQEKWQDSESDPAVSNNK